MGMAHPAHGLHLLNLLRGELDGVVRELVGLLTAGNPGEGVVRPLDVIGNSPSRGLTPSPEWTGVLEARENILNGLI